MIFFIIGSVLAGTGLGIYSFSETDVNYPFTHSAWHVIIALSLLFLLPPRPVQERVRDEVVSIEDTEGQQRRKIPSVAGIRARITKLRQKIRGKNSKSTVELDVNALLSDENVCLDASQNYELVRAEA